VVMRTIDASDGVGALVEWVFTSCRSAIAAWWRWLWLQVRCVVGTYLDGGNGVGKIPPQWCRRHVLGGRNVVPNIRILLWSGHVGPYDPVLTVLAYVLISGYDILGIVTDVSSYCHPYFYPVLLS
jgi:hypothetical protein